MGCRFVVSSSVSTLYDLARLWTLSFLPPRIYLSIRQLYPSWHWFIPTSYPALFFNHRVRLSVKKPKVLFEKAPLQPWLLLCRGVLLNILLEETFFIKKYSFSKMAPAPP